jgi:hypothetical protein
MFPEMDPDLVISGIFLLGLILVGISVLLSILYLYLSFEGRLADFIRKKKEGE